MFRLSRLLGPGILFTGVVASLILSESGHAPRLGEILKAFFESKGLMVLPAIVFIEYLYGLNFFFPGALTILFAMSSCDGNLRRAALVFLVIWIFSLAGTIASYFLGRAEARGSRDNGQVERRLEQVGAFIAYGHPLTASIRAFQRGADSVVLGRYFPELFVSNFCWNIFWGVVAYRYGDALTSGNTFAWLLLAYAVYWFRREWLIDRT